MRNSGLLSKRLVIFEMQERLLPAVHKNKDVLANVMNLAKSAKILKVPIILTEQYPKGLGRTVPELLEVLGTDVQPLEKLSFSAFGSTEFRTKLEELNAKTLILCGLECHICINQTALDALNEGYVAHVVADATSSRTKDNYKLGLKKMRHAGAVITSTETALYELMEVAKTEEFDEVLKVLK
jgi:nicotinamidase-related amidase